MADGLDNVTREVSEIGDVVDSAVALINGLAGEIRDAAGDEDALNELANRLDSKASELAAAVAANTPVAEDTNAGTETEAGPETTVGEDTVAGEDSTIGEDSTSA